MGRMGNVGGTGTKRTSCLGSKFHRFKELILGMQAPIFRHVRETMRLHRIQLD